jgi:dCMP deaminase
MEHNSQTQGHITCGELQTMNNDNWDLKYLEMAELVSEWSKDNAKVGAVIVRNNRVIATGFNGFPTDVLDLEDRLKDRVKKLDMTVHAEVNALIVAGRSAEGATLYVHGKPVCCRCAASIIQVGIKRVVAMHPDEELARQHEKNKGEPTEDDLKWFEAGNTALEMFLEAREMQFHQKTVERLREQHRQLREQLRAELEITNGDKAGLSHEIQAGQHTNGNRDQTSPKPQ